jgi:hypothetical protein
VVYGLTRATVTLLGAAVAGLLVWIATQVGDESIGDYWLTYGLIAAAGLTMALSQLLGGWTKWGWPRVSLSVFLWAFLPTAIAVVWITCFHQPHGNWFKDHARSWSNDIGIDGFVDDFKEYVGVLAFGLGLVFGFTFDTTGPATGAFWRGRRRRGAAARPAGTREPEEAGPTAREREAEREEAPAAEPAPREGAPTTRR